MFGNTHFIGKHFVKNHQDKTKVVDQFDKSAFWHFEHVYQRTPKPVGGRPHKC